MSEKETESPKPRPSGLAAFWKELRRRHVVRVAITYAVVAWLIIQIAASTFEGFGIPDWAFRFVVIMVILGFPIAVLLAWAFELTPEGIKPTKTAKVQNPDSHKDVSHAKKRHWFSLGLAAAVPTLIFGVLAGFFYIQNRSLVSNVEAPISGPVFKIEENDRSIAVLPLENMSPDPGNAFFADGVQEDILTNLSKIKEMGVVISRSSTLKYRDPDRNIKQVGQELGVRYIVEGSVRRAANQVRVTVQLIDSQTDDHLWAENYDRPLDNIFTIQSEIAKQIADQLQAVISPQEIEQIEIRPTENQEAYDYFLRAMNPEITSRFEMGPILDKAVELDPDFYQAWAEIASWNIIEWNLNSNRQDSERYDKAQHALDQLERLAPDSPELLFVKNYFAYSEDDNLEAAADYLLKARLKGLDHWDLGWRYLELGRLDEAQLYHEEAVRKNPYHPAVNQRLFLIYTLRELWDKADDLVNRNQKRLEGSSFEYMLLFWKQRTSYLKFLRSGDRSLYDFEGVSIPGYTDLGGQIMSAVISRDLNEGIEQLEASGLGYLNITKGRAESPSLIGWNIEPASLVTALMHFELGNEEEALAHTRNAKEYWEGVLTRNTKAKPEELAQLAICYAMEGEREKMEATIPKIRALTENVNWQFRAQASCEMKIAVAILVLGDHEKAIETLENASKMDGPIFLNRELDLWFIFDRLRGDPRFDALLEG